MFTKETARLAALNSHKPTSARFVHPVEIDTETQVADEFRRLRLSRVRAQLNQLDKMIAEEEDPQKIDRLASAQAKLSEQERQLSGRSMPPVVRTREIKPPPRQIVLFEPVAERITEPITELITEPITSIIEPPQIPTVSVEITAPTDSAI